MDETSLKKLTKRAKDIEITDHDVDDWEDLQSCFYEHYNAHIISRFYKQAATTGSGRDAGRETSVCLFSDLFCNGENSALCGFVNGTCMQIDLNKLSNDDIIFSSSKTWMHKGLSCVRCSNVSPYLFFSSSMSDGIIRQWDTRTDSKTPAQKFSSGTPTTDSGKAVESKGDAKPIIHFDISCNDQLLCGGTELMKEDSYLLFWDVRSTQILGAYWESHSDDVTSVKFHPSNVHSLVSGSVDGLLNVFNLQESAEDDALQYSFNTESSVDSLVWNCLPKNISQVTCITHTNEVQVWDATSGDRVGEIKRGMMAKAMRRSNPDAVYITSSHKMVDTSRVGLLACSLSGGNTRLVELNDDMQPIPRGLFIDQTAVVQTAQNIPTSRRWITFDESGTLKIWTLTPGSANERKHSRKITNEERRSKKRLKQ